MKKGIVIGIGTLLALLLLVRYCVLDIVDMPEGRCPKAGSWALVNRWAYGYRLPWSADTRIANKKASRGDWMAYNRPIAQRGEEPDTTTVCIGRCSAGPGDTLWYNNESGRIADHKDVRNGFSHMLIVPGKGKKLNITNDNLHFYALTIMLHEPVKASIVGDSLCVSGRMQGQYTFRQDYYWITTEDPKDLSDSRTFGFVPHVSLVGRIL